MKRVQILFFAAFFFLINILSIQSQVSLYSFTQFTSAYTSITGGTVFGNSSSDDEVFINTAFPGGQGVGSTGPGLPLGFTFTLNGIQFDRIGINCNGFIMLATSSFSPYCATYLTNAFLPISSTSTVNSIFQHKVVALGFDIQGQTSGSGSDLRMETIGSSPNRTAVVQWTGFRKYNNTGDDFNFQIRLNEGTNIIEVRYGNFVNNSASGTAEVGLRGASNSDFNNRFVNAVNTWSNSSAGVLANTVVNFNINLSPPSGLVYRWTPPPMCTGTPSTGAIIASPLVICPGGSSTLNLSHTYTNTGINYQWQSSSTSSLGPFTSSPNVTIPVYIANNVPVSRWYQCAVICSGSGLSSTTAPIQIQTTGAQVSNTPYLEDFEGIIVNNQLPNCSWIVTNPSVICQTYTSSNTNNRVPRSGYGFASFRYGTLLNGDSFFTSGIQLNAGVTYSASVWYVNDATPGWNMFSLMYGPNQSTVGLTNIATIYNNIANIVYQPLANTFTVSTSGVYYLAIRAIGNNTVSYLSFDDISVTTPCSLNNPTLNITNSNSVICSGDQSTLTVSGANNYSWSNGSNTSTIVVSPGLTSTYTAIGTITNTGCARTVSTVVQVNPLAQLGIFASPLSVCKGSSTNLFGFGAVNYTWSNGSTAYSTAVNPIISTSYSVVGTNAYGCQSSANILINVLPSPTLNAFAYPNILCAGETSTLSGYGAASYFWLGSNTLYSKAQNFIITPTASILFTLTGTAANGCESAFTVSVQVNPCTALEKNISDLHAFNVAPNPFDQKILISNSNKELFDLRIIDLTGKLCFEKKNIQSEFEFNNELPKGIYIVRVTTETSTSSFKIIKQ